MIDLRRTGLLATILVAVALTAAACSGAATTQTPVAVADATPPPVDITPTLETPAGEATPESVIPSFDLGGLTNNLANVDSYRIAISVAGSTVYRATVIGKPENAEQITLGEGADATAIIKIGTDSWISTGGGKFVKDDLGMANGLIGAFDPLLLFGTFANGNIASVSNDLGAEQKNGINAHHYRFDSTSSLAGSFGLPAGAGLDFWVSDEGYLVAYEFTGTAAEQNMSINISNVDDPANKVERPS